MTANVPVTTPEKTVGDIRTMLERHAKDFDAMQYVYVLDDSRKLTGVISLHELFRAKQSAAVGDVCTRSGLLWVHPGHHQEEAAYLALQNGIKAVPVVDHDRTFLGSIPGDTLLHILYKETHEDMLRRAGVHHGHPLFDNVLTLPLHTSILHRLPWLLLGLLGGIFAAEVVGFFEQTLSQNLILAAFIPLVVYMSSAVGTQTEAFIIRDLAFDRKIPFMRYFFRQLTVTAVISLCCAGAFTLMSLLLHGNARVSVTIGLALSIAVMSSLLTGLLIPYLFSRFRSDPANASGPIATIVQDILSLLIYFVVATMMLG